jgi:hypothetical protein
MKTVVAPDQVYGQIREVLSVAGLIVGALRPQSTWTHYRLRMAGVVNE